MDDFPGIKRESRPYKPWGAADQCFYCKERLVIMDGPAGTGKSRAWLEKLHLLAEKYPGFRGLIVRKTRESLTESGLFTFEEKVVPVGHPILANNQQRNFRQHYLYPNGSEIVCGGMDKSTKIMSTEYDVIYVQEATELTEDDVEKLTTRARNYVVPYQQVIMDCNPDKPTHWIWQRILSKTITRIQSSHEDNPVLYDHTHKKWTPQGIDYLTTLDDLSGARLERLRWGRWVASEGQIYTDWNPDHHLVDSFKVPIDWRRWWTVDFGYQNPFVWQAWAEMPDGELICYREIYQTERLVEDHAKIILHEKSELGDPWPVAVICDHDAEDRATLERHLGLRTIAAHKAVSDGIQAVAARLKLRSKGDDRKAIPRLMFMRDALVEKDSNLQRRRLPTCTVEEFDGYVWDSSAKQETANQKDKPRKKDDHGMDTLRYLIAHVDRLGQPKASEVAIGAYSKGPLITACPRNSEPSVARTIFGNIHGRRG